jgi:hypothetical protein
LPDELKGGMADGVLVAFERPDTHTTKATLHWTWDPLELEYQHLTETKSFPAKCQLAAWWKLPSGNWVLRLKPDTAHDLARLQDLGAEVVDWFCVVGRRDFKSVGTAADTRRELSPWLARTVCGRFSTVAAGLVDVELTGGAFSTPDLSLETLADTGLYPALHCYCGRKEDFVLYPSNALKFQRTGGNAALDTDEKRYFKVTLANWKRAQELADVAAVNYDRNDFAMCPQGTYSRDWGARAASGYELVDVQGGLKACLLAAPGYGDIADLDQALGNILAGTATPEQAALVQHIDKVLGQMVTTTQQYYNE